MSTYRSVLTLALLTTGLLSAQPSITSKYDFKVIDHPNAVATFQLGINDHRVIAGFFVDPNGVNHGFLWKNGVFTEIIDFPGAAQVPGAGTVAGGINNRGDIVGTYSSTDGFQHGFRRALPEWCEEDSDDHNCKPVFTKINVPGAAQTKGIFFELGTGLGTAGIGINNADGITGMYATNGLYSNAFILSRGDYKHIDAPMTPPAITSPSRTPPPRNSPTGLCWMTTRRLRSL